MLEEKAVSNVAVRFFTDFLEKNRSTVQLDGASSPSEIVLLFTLISAPNSLCKVLADVENNRLSWMIAGSYESIGACSFLAFRNRHPLAFDNL